MTFPAELRVDYIRVWQRKGIENGVSCDPPSQFTPSIYLHEFVLSLLNSDRPTAKYIAE